MNETQREQLRLVVAQCRRILEADLARQLEGMYGVRASGEIYVREQLTDLDAFGLHRRDEIVQAIRHFEAQDMKPATAVERFIRESAFTVFNRLAALKLMEHPSRKLLRQPVVENGTLSPTFLKHFQAVAPEALRDTPDGGYQLFLEMLFDDLSRTPALEAVFSRRTPQSILFPAPPALAEVLHHLNDDSLQAVWDDDETIGWLYQFFTPEEQRKKSRKDSPGRPRNSYELAFRNQFFTPRYIVRFLVDNTLGRLWWEMRQGDSVLATKCEYLIRSSQGTIQKRDKVDPRQLRALDPACGSAHFLLYGFDVFLDIYTEAYDDPDLGPQLKIEYPTREEYDRAIPGLILEHNLHGIDIDRRAAQIARLALWLKAQRALNTLVARPHRRDRYYWVRSINVALTEPMPGEANLLQEFANSILNPIVRELVPKLWEGMSGIGELGSLLKIEQELHMAITAAQKNPAWKQSELWPVAESALAQQLNSELSFLDDQAFWDGAAPLVIEELRSFAQGQTYDHYLFASDTKQGLAFISMLLQPFDVVWMNPPFGAPIESAEKYLKRHYPLSGNDLYAAFVDRGLQLLRPGGLLGAITSRTGFFLTSFREWREQVLLPKTRIHAMADLGNGVLDTAMVETAAYVLEKRAL